jgi:carbonic anhydrase
VSEAPSLSPRRSEPQASPLVRDLTASVVVFLVALPLCLGIALASGAPLFSGIISGVVGGIVVGLFSGSHTSVSGPAAGLTAVVLAQIAVLGSFEAFLLAVLVAGVIQIGLGFARAGILSSFVPNSVIRGLLAAIGIILILKQIPHIFGHDADPEGDMAFAQPDHENTFSELFEIFGGLHLGATVIGLLSLALLVFWDRYKPLKHSRVPAPLAVVGLGLGLGAAFEGLGGSWAITGKHLVDVPVAESLAGFLGFVRMPDFSQWNNPAIYVAALTIAVVASLETLLNVEAIDKIDPKQRATPPNRELWAQGAGNIAAGLLGGIPITSVVVRGSVNIDAGAATKRSTVLHGTWLLLSVALLPMVLNRIPLACLAAILLLTGYRLASPALIRRMWSSGREQFIPFAVTVVAIVLTDLLIGLVIGMIVSVGFILSRHSRRPLRWIREKHLDGEVLHIEFPEQVSFLNHMSIERSFDEIPRDSRVLLDARETDYIDPDVLDLIREFRELTAPARNIKLSMIGFHDSYELQDDIQFVDYSTRDLQDRVSPVQVLDILREGNHRFRTGARINRDLARQIYATATGQHPLAVVLSCIDSRTPAELLFDMGLGDLFSVRVAGNVISPKVLGSMEYGCAIAGARLIVVLGHTRCGAVTAAVELANAASVAESTRCQHLDRILTDIQVGVDLAADLAGAEPFERWEAQRKTEFVDDVARRNVISVVERIVSESETIANLVSWGRIAVVGVLYDVATGKMEFLLDHAIGLDAGRDAPRDEPDATVAQ